MPDFSIRSDELELMDDLSLEGDALAQNLEELEVINRRLGGNKVVIRALEQMLPELRAMDRKIEVADLGTGGGDLPRAIIEWARKKQLDIRVIGVDANPFMVDFARDKATEYPEVEFEIADIFSPEFTQRKFDICLCSLICHHFEDEAVVKMLAQLEAQSKLGFVVNDLHRHPLAYYSIQFLTWLLRGSHLVRNDAPLSVLRAFKRKELEELARKARISHFELKWKWAFRYQLIGRIR